MYNPWSDFREIAKMEGMRRLPSNLEFGIVSLFPNTWYGDWGVFLREGEVYYPLCYLPDGHREWCIEYICDSYVLSVPEGDYKPHEAERKKLYPETEVSKWDRDELWLNVPQEWVDFWWDKISPQFKIAHEAYYSEFQEKMQKLQKIK